MNSIDIASYWLFLFAIMLTLFAGYNLFRTYKELKKLKKMVALFSKCKNLQEKINKNIDKTVNKYIE